MFSCKQKSISLEQLKENREKQIKSLDGNLDFPTKLLFTGIAFFVMYLMSDYVLKTLFDALTRVDGFDTRVQFVLNMVMYIMPWFFGFISVGLMSVAAFIASVEIGYSAFVFYRFNKRIKKRQQDEKNTNEPQQTQPHDIQYQESGALSVRDLHYKAAALAGHANTAYWESLMCAFGDEAHARGFIVLTIDEYQQQIVTWEIEDLDAQDKSHLGCTVIKARQKLFSPTIAPDIVDRIVTTGTEDGYNTYWADTILNALEKEGLVVVKTTKTELPNNG
ncbi:hypothetical protein J8Z82_10510 [Yersinia enterocolitica]|uniref:hypothetical protein n=1 Tax=Yersinia enterocolitica TaxID=630 RepID=UPI001C8E2693|nr:hypothetical protein [Yersinia enterocolitica]MBX9485940.1 hypothetical protein [Yersinia enterocolitica]MBX9492219.1 hypothetical protein [Yersinia enterocolitica]